MGLGVFDVSLMEEVTETVGREGTIAVAVDIGWLVSDEVLNGVNDVDSCLASGSG